MHDIDYLTDNTKPTVSDILNHLHKVGRGIEGGALGDPATLEAMEATGLVERFGTVVYLTPKGRDNIVTTATVLTIEPGNGTRYVIVHGTSADGDHFVAVPNLGVAATMTPHPAEWGYIAEKLHLGELDAKAVFAALNPEREV